MKQATIDNIDEIASLVAEVKKNDGYQMSNSINTELHMIRGKLIALSDGDVDFYFERVNSNARVGMYKITLKCDDEAEELINEKIT